MIINNVRALMNYQLVAAAHTCSNQIWDGDVKGQGEETRTHALQLGGRETPKNPYSGILYTVWLSDLWPIR